MVSTAVSESGPSGPHEEGSLRSPDTLVHTLVVWVGLGSTIDSHGSSVTAVSVETVCEPGGWCLVTLETTEVFRGTQLPPVTSYHGSRTAVTVPLPGRTGLHRVEGWDGQVRRVGRLLWVMSVWGPMSVVRFSYSLFQKCPADHVRPSGPPYPSLGSPVPPVPLRSKHLVGT